jgi:hypothetical protein
VITIFWFGIKSEKMIKIIPLFLSEVIQIQTRDFTGFEFGNEMIYIFPKE